MTIPADLTPTEPTSAVEPNEAPPPSPPLAIAHLLLWMTGLAIIGGVGRTCVEAQGGDWIPGSRREALNIFLELLFTAVVGTALAAALLWIARRWVYHIPFPTQPGHYLLLILCFFGTSMMSERIINVFFLSVRLHAPEWNSALWLAIPAVLQVGAVSVSVWAVRTQSESRLWQVFFGLLTGVTLCWAAILYSELLAYTSGTQIWDYLGIILLLAGFGLAAVSLTGTAAAISDARGGQARDWLHYTGLVTFTLALVGVVIVVAASR